MSSSNNEISKEKYDKLTRAYLKAKPKKWKCPKGHIIDVEIGGKYESVILWCDKCYKGYVINRSEIEAL